MENCADCQYSNPLTVGYGPSGLLCLSTAETLLMWEESEPTQKNLSLPFLPWSTFILVVADVV